MFTIEVIIALGIALILARMIAYIFNKMNQPDVIGEILAGVILSAIALLPFYINWIPQEMTMLNLDNPIIDFLSDLGLILVLFIAGMGVDIRSLKSSGKTGLKVASLGVIFPLLISCFVALLFFEMTFLQSVIIGMIFVATSIVVTARTLMTKGILKREEGTTILTAAVFDDIIAILLLAIILGTYGIFELIIGLTLFFIVSYLLTKGIFRKLMHKISRRVDSKYDVVSICLGIILLFVAFAMVSGIAAITGAFVIGMIFGESREMRFVHDHIYTIGFALFIPIFFIKVGTHIDLTGFADFNLFLLIFIPIGIFGKFIGCSLGAKWGGMNKRGMMLVGIGMVPGLEMDLIIAKIAYDQGVFNSVGAAGLDMSNQIMLLIILYVIFTAIITPYLLIKLYKKYSES